MRVFFVIVFGLLCGDIANGALSQIDCVPASGEYFQEDHLYTEWNQELGAPLLKYYDNEGRYTLIKDGNGKYEFSLKDFDGSLFIGIHFEYEGGDVHKALVQYQNETIQFICNSNGAFYSVDELYPIGDRLFREMIQRAKVCGEHQDFDKEVYEFYLDEDGNRFFTIYFSNSFVDAVVFDDFEKVPGDRYEVLRVLCDK